MKDQTVPVFYDEKTLGATQYSSALQGIRAAAARYDYHVQMIPAEQSEDIAGRDLPDAVIAVSVSMPVIEKLIRDMRRQQKTVVLSGIDCEQFGPDVSCATPSRRTETQQLVNYLYNCDRRRIALVGFGENSINDTFRRHAAMTAAAAWGNVLSEKDVWLWQHDPSECFDDFFKVWERYDAVICPNDVIAICLMNACKKQGILIPDQIYLASFGNMSVGNYFRPAITSMSMDMHCVGEQTFNVWRFLLSSGNAQHTSLKITVPSRIMVRESTGGEIIASDSRPPSQALRADRFYYNPVISDLLGIDNCIAQRDNLDMKIIKSLIDRDNYETIEDKYYISASALRYRLNKIFADAGVGSRKEFEALIHEHLGDGNPFSFVE